MLHILLNTSTVHMSILNVTFPTFLLKFFKPGVPTRSVTCKLAYFCSLGHSRIFVGSNMLDRQRTTKEPRINEILVSLELCVYYPRDTITFQINTPVWASHHTWSCHVTCTMIICTCFLVLTRLCEC